MLAGADGPTRFDSTDELWEGLPLIVLLFQLGEFVVEGVFGELGEGEVEGRAAEERDGIAGLLVKLLGD